MTLKGNNLPKEKVDEQRSFYILKTKEITAKHIKRQGFLPFSTLY